MVITQWGKFELGADGISEQLAQGGFWDAFLLPVYDRYLNQESVVLDVGAHIGSHTVYLAQKVRLVYAFEPQLFCYNCLLKNVELNNLNNVIAYNVAVFSESGVKFEMDKQVDYDTFRFSASLRVVETKNGHINSITIDSLNLKQINFIKIDAEGLDNEVIRGGLESIKELRPVITFEIFDRFKLDEAQKLLKPLNYTFEELTKNDYLGLP